MSDEDGDSSEMVAVLDWDTSFLAGFIAETVLWVSFLALFIYTLYRWRKVAQGVWLYIATVVLFITATIHWAFGLKLVITQNIPVNGLAGIYFSQSVQDAIGATVASLLTSSVGDLVMTYRLYIVFSRRWFITVVPICMTIVSFVTQILSLAYAVSGANGGPTLSDDTFVVLNYTSAIGPLISNTIITLGIVGRICFTLRDRDIEINKNIRSIVTTVVECGFILLVIQTLLVVFTKLSSPPLTPIGFIATQLYGIAPTLITAGVNHNTILRRRDPNATGPIATTRIGVTPDAFVMSHLSELSSRDDWHDMGEDSSINAESFKSSMDDLKKA